LEVWSLGLGAGVVESEGEDGDKAWRFACHFDFAVDTLDYRYTFLDELGLVTRIFREEERRAVMEKSRSM
jgi:hypothetical protein